MSYYLQYITWVYYILESWFWWYDDVTTNYPNCQEDWGWWRWLQILGLLHSSFQGETQRSKGIRHVIVPINYLIHARLLSLTLYSQVQLHRITKGSQTSSFLLGNRQPILWLHNLCLEVLTVHGNEFWAKASHRLCLFMLHIWHSSSRNNF